MDFLNNLGTPPFPTTENYGAPTFPIPPLEQPKEEILPPLGPSSPRINAAPPIPPAPIQGEVSPKPFGPYDAEKSKGDLEYKPKAVEPRPVAQQAVSQQPSMGLKQQLTRNVVKPELIQQKVKLDRQVTDIASQMKKAGTLSSEEYDNFIKAQMKYAQAIDPNNEASVVFKTNKKMEETKAQLRELGTEIKDLKNLKVDPERYTKNMPKFDRILNALDTFTSTYLKRRGLMQKDVKTFSDRVRDEIRQDISLQLQEIRDQKEGAQTQYNLLTAELNRHGNEQTAALALETKLLMAAQAQLESTAKQKQLSAEQKYGITLLKAQTESQIANNMLNLYTGKMVESVVPTGGAESIAKQRKEIAEVRRDIRERTTAVPQFDDKGRVLTDDTGKVVTRSYLLDKGTTESQQRVVKKLEDLGRFSKLLDDIESLEKEYKLGGKLGVGGENRELKGKLETLSMEAKMILKNKWELGVLNGPDLELINKVIADPAALFEGLNLGRRDALRKSIKDEVMGIQTSQAKYTPRDYVNNIYGGLGVDPGIYYPEDYGLEEKRWRAAMAAKKILSSGEKTSLVERQRQQTQAISEPAPISSPPSSQVKPLGRMY